MRGAENFEDPLCYTSSGLTGNGTIDTINLTDNTIKDLLNHNFKSAMFETPFTGHFDMECAAWTGNSNFSNNGTDFLGEFKIIGPVTDWEGTYKLVLQEGNIMAVETNYILYPHGKKASGNITHVNKTYYM